MAKILIEKIYCDRCGAEIKDKNRVSLLIRRKFYIIHELIPMYKRDDWKREDSYLCLNCENEYIKWFNQPKEKIK